MTVFCPTSPKYKNTLQQSGLDSVHLAHYEMPAERNRSLYNTVSDLFRGGPLAKLSEPVFPAMVAYYSKRPLPLAIISDFFTPSALDAGDFLSVSSIVFYPNPLSFMTSILAPHLRTPWDLPHVWALYLGEAILARVMLWFRNRQRSVRSPEYNLPHLTEQDIYPTLSMQRPVLATTALGLEYPFPQSPLLHFMGASPPCNVLTRDPYKTDPELFEWLDKQEAVVYVAFGTVHNFTEASVNILFEQLKRIASAPHSHLLLGQSVSVLWSLPANQQAMLRSETPKNLRLETFVPQWDVLASRRVLVFVSHCGANSLYESLLNGTPVVCCPGKADQPGNAARVHSAQAGLISPQGVRSVEASLQQIFNEIRFFTEHACAIRDLFVCQGGASTGANVVEQIISCGSQRLTPHKSCNDRYSWTAWALFLIVTAIVATAVSYT